MMWGSSCIDGLQGIARVVVRIWGVADKTHVTSICDQEGQISARWYHPSTAQGRKRAKSFRR